ncbi:MAG: chromosome segregation ATPase [Halioglobus sp.]|jgi:chromosome segregation ATPase
MSSIVTAAHAQSDSAEPHNSTSKHNFPVLAAGGNGGSGNPTNALEARIFTLEGNVTSLRQGQDTLFQNVTTQTAFISELQAADVLINSQLSNHSQSIANVESTINSLEDGQSNLTQNVTTITSSISEL